MHIFDVECGRLTEYEVVKETDKSYVVKPLSEFAYRKRIPKRFTIEGVEVPPATTRTDALCRYKMSLARQIEHMEAEIAGVKRRLDAADNLQTAPVREMPVDMQARILSGQED